MTFHYAAAIDVADPRNGLGNVSLATAGKTTITVNVSTLTADPVVGSGTVTIFNHGYSALGECIGEDRDGSTWMQHSFSPLTLAGKLLQGLQGAAIAAGWGSDGDDLGVGFDPTTLVYDIEYSANTTLTFANAATARLFGFGSLSYSGAAIHYSDITPWGIIRPVLTAVSSPTPNFEPEGIAVQAVSSGSAVSGMARSIAPLYRDWVQQYETKEKTLRLSALSAHPFTHQELFETCRTIVPFVVVDGFGDGRYEVFFFRGEGSNWKCERANDGNDAQFHVSYKTLVAGYLPVPP